MLRKKTKVFFLLLLTFVCTIFGINNVKAETDKIVKGDAVSGPYYITHYRESGPTRWLWDQLNFLKRSSDGAYVYCVQPFVTVNSNATYNVTTEDMHDLATISYDNWKIIEKIAYYGHGYVENGIDHSADKWWAASQMLIWQYASPTVESYFTRTLQGTRDDTILADEMAEIMNLVNNHNVLPSFDNVPTQMIVGNTITISDTRNVLSNFNIDNIKGGNVTKNGNSLSITATEVGNITFDLIKLGNKYGEPTKLYYAVDSQNVVRRGNVDPIKTKFEIKVTGGRVTPNKYDDETLTNTPQGEGSLSGAVYGIYKEDGTKIGTVTTGTDGRGTSDYLPSLGRFYLLEEKASPGYQLDRNKYYFDITLDNLNPNVQVFEKVISLDFDITKVYADSKTGIMTPETDVIFGIYNNKGEEVRRLTTDSQGNIKFKLPYGTYTVKQLTTTQGFEKAEDFTLEVKETGPVVKRVIANAEITSRLKVVKVDQDGNNITKAGIKFKIKDLSTGNYVCQKVSYPTATTYCEYETDENGVLITPYPLNSGRYQLEEVDQVVYGYVWNSTPLLFTIDESADIKKTEEFDAILEVHFENQEVKGVIEINKVGEKVVIENGTYTYIEIPLPKVMLGLFDESGTLIRKLETDENGFARFENLKLGKYIVKEISTVGSHILDNSEYEFNLEYKDQYTPIIKKTFTLKNYLSKGKLDFSKTDLTTGKELPNVEIKIYTVDDELVFSGLTDEFGKITIENLFVGKFYIVESETLTGYKLSDEKIYFEIKENGEVIKASMTNEKFKGDFEFTKIDLSTGDPLPNTLIEVYNADTDELIFSGRTDESGKIIIKNLEYGKYYILEKEAPESYVLNEEKMYFEILEDGEIVKTTMTNEKIKADLEFTKIDLSTGDPLPNTLIEVYNADTDELIFSGRTDESGKIIIKNLEYGKYYILEKEAPENYILNEERMYYEIKENGEVVKATMTNEKVEMPKTFNTDLTSMIIIGGTALIGLGLLVYAKRKNEK